MTKAPLLRDLSVKSNSMPNTRTEIIVKLAEASPFWAGAFAACIDQGFDTQGTQELLEKCAQADPILEEEYAVFVERIKSAGWWDELGAATKAFGKSLASPFDSIGEGAGMMADATGRGARAVLGDKNVEITKGLGSGLMEGAENIGSTLSNAGTTLVGGAATGLAGVAAAGEGAYNAAATAVDGNERANLSYEAMKALKDQTVAAAQDLGSNVANVADPTARSNKLDETANQIFDDAGVAQDSGLRTARDVSKAVGDTALNTAATLVAPGAILNAGKGTIQGLRTGGNLTNALAQGGSRGAQTLQAFAPRLTATATKMRGGNFANAFDAANKTRAAATSAHPYLNFGMRNSLLPAAGQGTVRSTLGGMTGVPEVLEVLPSITRALPSLSRLATPAGSYVPALPAIAGAEVFDQGVQKLWNIGSNQLNPGNTQIPDGTGFAAYANMPEAVRPLINGTEIELPGAEVYTNAINNKVDPQQAFNAAFEEFRRIGGVQPDPLTDMNASARGRSLLNMPGIPGSEQILNLYPNNTPPTISMTDPGLLKDFMKPLGGLAHHRSLQDGRSVMAHRTNLLQQLGTVMPPEQHEAFLALYGNHSGTNGLEGMNILNQSNTQR